MPDALLGRLSARRLRTVDAALALWVAAWVALGAWTGVEVRGLATLSDTVGTAGEGLAATSDALDALGRAPLVGGQVGELSAAVDAAADSATRSGPASREHIERLSVLLALAIAVVPSAPVLLLWLPARRARRRDVRALRSDVALDGDDPRLLGFLARRAVAHLPYETLCRGDADPWTELAEGRHRRLADLELRHLGLRPAASGRRR